MEDMISAKFCQAANYEAFVISKLMDISDRVKCSPKTLVFMLDHICC